MSSEDWSTLQRLFDEISRLSPEAQVDALARVSDEHPALVDELRGLLSHTGDDHALTGLVHTAADGLIADQRDRIVGSRFGAYRIVAHLARGGMGEVYEGARDDGTFEQRVAIKLIRFGAGDAAVRFNVERQILAKLNHPNICRIFDGGTTPEGIAYFVMEYVEGVPIDEYCREHDLPVRARLRLFRVVCEAVEFAHQNLIVHRDIKPSNILITADGTPKLLDFGIAKLIGGDGEPDRDDETQAASRVMTPDFASPEQVLGQGITTASDVYSLGVLLYLLVSGERPYSTAGLRPSQIEKIVTETMPARPSQAVARGSRSDGTTLARNRDKWARHLGNDIDAICMKALRKEPEIRYGSAHRLSADVRRHLEGLPVSAQGRTWAYVARKFMQRNAVPLAAASAVAVAALTGAVYHERTLTRERDQVLAEAEKSAAVSRFLINTFETSSPDESRGATITAKEILDNGTARLQSDLESQPATRALLSATIGDVYESLGLYAEAKTQLEAAVALYEGLGDLPGLADSLRTLAFVEFQAGDFDAANAAYERAFAVRQRHRPEDHVELAIHLNDLGFIAGVRGEYALSIERLEGAIAMLERIGATEGEHYYDFLHDLGQTQQLAGDSRGAEANLRGAVEFALEQTGELDTQTLIYMGDLATVLHDLGQYAEAEGLYLRVVEGERQLFGEVHADREAVLTNLGRLYGDMNRLDDAERYLREAASIAAQTRGPRHTFTAYDLVNVANLLTQKGEHAEAQTIFEEALSIYDENLEPDHPYIASAKAGYAALLNNMGAPDASLAQTERALEICAVALPAGHWLTASITSIKGESLMLQGDLDTAEPMLVESYGALVESDPRQRITTNALRRLVRLYELRGDEASFARYSALLEPAAAPAR